MKFKRNKLFYILLIIVFSFLILFLIKIKSLRKLTSLFGSENDDNKIYVFWTGGYDSTFRICQAIIDEDKIVQPIYISDIIDNLPQNATRRKNRKFEYAAMNKIIKNLHKYFPKTKKKLLPLIDIKNITVDPEITHHMKILKSQKRVRRAVCQYGAMAQVTKNMNKNIEICVENEPGSMLNKTMNGKIFCPVSLDSNICYLKDNLKDSDLSLNIFKRFVFSTIKYTKKDMLNIARKNGYDNILKMTWSCWYPVNGQPCGRCIMCHERIV